MREKRITITLGAVLDMIAALEQGDIDGVKERLHRAAAVEEREKMRTVRNEVWQRYQNALRDGDAAAAAEYKQMLNDVTALSAAYKV